jgi:hypothetical protein
MLALTLRRLPAAAFRHPDPLLRFYFDQLGDHWPAHRWLAARGLGLAAGREAARLGISAAERRLILGRVEPDRYVSMSVRRGIHRLLNPAAVPMSANLLKDKAAFARFAAEERLAAPLTAAKGGASAIAGLLESGAVILKPSFSSKGRGVVRAERTGREWYLSTGERLIEPDLALRMERTVADGGVAQEALTAHPSLADISPGALPTARVMTFRIGAERPVCGLFVVRLGGGAAPVDNFNHGGLIATPDEEGRIVEAYGRNRSGGLARLGAHPATGRSLGRTLPRSLTEGAAALALEAHSRLPEGFTLVGWDVGLSHRGPMLIEGNWNPGTVLPQSAAGAGLSQMPLGALYRKALERVEPECWAAARAVEIDG